MDVTHEANLRKAPDGVALAFLGSAGNGVARVTGSACQSGELQRFPDEPVMGPPARQPTRRSQRPGYILLWVLMLAAVAAVVIAAAAPSLIAAYERTQAQTTANDLTIFGTGALRFFTIIGNTPGRLSELDSMITTTPSVTPTACGTASVSFKNPQLSLWTANAPFTTVFVGSNGYFAPLGTVRDSIQRIPTAPTNGTDTLALLLPAVDSNRTLMLDAIIDNGDGANAGTIRWTTATAGKENVQYRVPFPAGKKC